MADKRNLSRNRDEKIPVDYPKFPISYPEFPVSYPKNPISYPDTKIPVSYPETSTIKEISDPDVSKRDPVLNYEVTRGKFGNTSKQSITYRGKKTRWN